MSSSTLMSPLVPSAPGPAPPLDSTFGAVLIGTFLGLMLYGLVVHQTYRYFSLYPRDSGWIKALVVSTLLFETAHIVLSTHICYYYLVTNYGNADAIQSSVWSLGWLVSAGAGAAFLADGLLTGVLVNLLHTQRTGVKSIDRIVDTLILYGVNTGLLTGLNTRSSLRSSANPERKAAPESASRSRSRSGPGETTLFEMHMQGQVVAPPHVPKVEVVENNSQAFLTFELVGIAV
uniref:Tox1 n=1 Tax=Ganoderma boninense TaxID=34458 RepID=A0A5K1JV17_9APHY